MNNPTIVWGVAADHSGLIQYHRARGVKLAGGGLRAWEERADKR